MEVREEGMEVAGRNSLLGDFSYENWLLLPAPPYILLPPP